MRFPLLIAIIMLVVNALVDIYIYCALFTCCRKKLWPRVQAYTSIILFAALVVAICLPKRGGSEDTLLAVMWILYSYLSVYLAKYAFTICDVLSRAPMLWHKHRCKWLSKAGAGLGVVIFAAMWWGALINKRMIDVNEIEVEVPGLPQSLDGLTIAQISDLHVGTYRNDTTFYAKLVREVNALNPDIIVFTGDIVNRSSSELPPFTSTLAKLHAPKGVYSIMGNHDYGDYSDWPSPQDKADDIRNLQRMQKEMGWTMLNNATAWIKADSDSIALIGVENVGDPPFTTYGDLNAAYPQIGDENHKILLSHNPAHWLNDIADNDGSNIFLTLSGHTHAMQTKIFGWSPAVWRYPTWGGMYADSKGQRLYVNIGAGEVGFPARIGATPEISLFTLKSTQ